MQIVRISVHGKSKYGVLEGKIVQGYRGNPFAQSRGRTTSFSPDGTKYKLDEVKFLAPCVPSKIIGVGLNYRSHIAEINRPIPSLPKIFLKPPTSIIGPDDKIILPTLTKRVDYEGELGVVIGKKARNIPEDQAKEYVLGYTCINDVSERPSQEEDGQWTRAKGYDTFAPMGPGINTGIDGDNLKLETYLNGELRQSASTSDLVFGVSKIVSFISGVMTLLPGDVIATGTTSGIGQMKPGDVVEIKIENIGTLKNTVVG
ncbi:fumarylacetoacetate hydrolase family protein [Chloroflexota bacterium]